MTPRPQPVTDGDRAPATWSGPFIEVERRRRPAPAADLPSGIGRLAADLFNSIRGEVRFDPGSRALYATDASNYRQVPIGVVLPRDTDDVVTAIEICRSHGAPIVSRGGGTSLAGQTCNVAVVLDHSKFNNDLIELDPDARWARVRPGLVLDELRTAAERHHLTYGPDPATHSHCTLGGMIGNNSCGVHSVMAGKTDDNVLELDVLTYEGDRFVVGRTSDDELIRIVGEGGGRGRIYAAMRAIRDTYAGEIRSRFPDIPRRVSGYNLPRLLPEGGFDVAKALVGSESTLATVLEAKVRLVESPPGRTLVVVGYPDVYAAADDVPEIMASGCIACEGMDDKLVRDVGSRGIHPDALGLLPKGNGFLLVEFGGADRAESDARAHDLVDSIRRRRQDAVTRLYDDPADEAKLWRVRESGLGATAMVPGKPTSGPGWEDSAVPPERLGDYLRRIRSLWDRHGLDADMYGHFGQGILHCRIDFDLVTAKGLDGFRRYMSDAAELVVRMGGSLSGEHGDGQARGELLPIMFGGQIVHAFEELKDAWDPAGKMNPGKLVRPNAMLSNLRLGTDYSPPKPRTYFRFPDDTGSFGHAAFRCVGVGECRRHEGGVMCPSYMVTREERHSTRGRARLLFELLNGSEMSGGWRNDDVEEALDLCLACKGCKGNCPVNVDMATYKAEFRAHHYAGRLRPRAAYTMGLIHWWAKFAARAPGLANAAARAPLIGQAAKWLGGVAPERSVPQFADRTFRHWWRERGGATTGRAHDTARVPRAAGVAAVEREAADGPTPGGRRGAGGRRRVILWVDTFSDHFHPDVARAAVTVLEDAGCDVVVPARELCCGRPLYDWGFLGQAKRLLTHILTDLRDEIRAGVPIVGLEPSCVSVFRDEAPNLLHGHVDARRLASQTHTLTEFLDSIGYRPPAIAGRALVHGHCHHKSVLDFESELRVLRATGLDLDVPDSGCCGMAGAFGFERSGDHYAVSMAAGERVLLPAVRAADSSTFVVTGGFSCREQIEQATPRRVLHPAELLALAIGRSAQDRGDRQAERATTDPARSPSDVARGAPTPAEVGG